MTPVLPASELLSGIVSIAAEERSLRNVLRRSAHLVVAATGADACFVHVVEREAAQVVLMGAHPDHFDRLAGTIRLRLGEGVAGWVAEHAEVAVVDDKWSDPRYRYIPALRGEDYRSLVSAPLLRPGTGVVGVVNVHAHRADHFAPDVVARLRSVADLLAGIVEGAILHERLLRREEQIEQFAEHTIELQEAERRRIAGDIHDGISQRLVSAWYHLRAAHAALDGSCPPALARELGAAEGLISEALSEARSAVSGLRPTVLDDLGLAAAIESLATAAGPFEVDTELEPCAIAPHLEMCVFRVAQEAIQNALKHSSARRLRVTLGCSGGELELCVADDGSGLPAGYASRNGAYGLGGMVERAALVGGRVEVVSTPGAGTEIRLHLPVGDRPLGASGGDLAVDGPPGPAPAGVSEEQGSRGRQAPTPADHQMPPAP
jgi:two-component system NarL family sensor kinase